MTNSSYIQIKCQLLEKKKKNNVENLYYSREVKEGSDFFILDISLYSHHFLFFPTFTVNYSSTCYFFNLLCFHLVYALCIFFLERFNVAEKLSLLFNNIHESIRV